MLPIRQLFIALFLGALTFVPVGASASSDKAKELARVEQTGLKATGKDRLNELLVQPAAAKGGVKLTRSWIDSQPKASGSAQWRCLTEALYFEARGETVKGQFAVAEVIMNRVKSGRFPGSLCGVINQGTGKKYQCQFTYTCDGHAEVISEPRAYARAGKVARYMMDGKVPALTKGATHYHTTAVNPRWARVYTRTAKIGVHLFYRHTWRTASN
ncbi:cell wall hydrolase [Sulfitobacter sp. M57]|uniref:cell wall hydrolase n=1 Tax=unclassified Sulfitobacter TaxID=196795 RepID=UPI0023E25DD2|nr:MULTISPECIES: cell wall hydrolase [unclassified Sulfitobacter]MDF3414166.1 cell wall hydrolase [Sulfitobacter sp. KE5]MDF3420553.1 cell wall hydrolase [Sulfitobacter sp. KE43]MDF3432712.1 cell wall hydrolase [Sulfitobacter sp. KE42]MDF3458351.1 cell wall hydrolase [Sulfitobacter sp. S74]MDF3462252.1 cell wall hydrolase [Sulfitobacter sp. Ks18]